MSETKELSKELKMKIIVDKESLNQQVSITVPMKRHEKNQLEYLCVVRKMSGENHLTPKNLIAELVRKYLAENQETLQALSAK